MCLCVGAHMNIGAEKFEAVALHMIEKSAKFLHIKNLANDKRYLFRLRATNAIGNLQKKVSCHSSKKFCHMNEPCHLWLSHVTCE